MIVLFCGEEGTPCYSGILLSSNRKIITLPYSITTPSTFETCFATKKITDEISCVKNKESHDITGLCLPKYVLLKFQ